MKTAVLKTNPTPHLRCLISTSTGKARPWTHHHGLQLHKHSYTNTLRCSDVYITRASSSVEERTKAPPEPISLTESALGHLCKLGEDKGFNPIVLRVGVKSGGCSGMSYVMDFVPAGEDGVQGDVVMAKADGRVEIRIDPKSLLYLFGLELDYSDELIGGGFKFQNPNAKNSCGCGTSFSV